METTKYKVTGKPKTVTNRTLIKSTQQVLQNAGMIAGNIVPKIIKYKDSYWLQNTEYYSSKITPIKLTN